MKNNAKKNVKVWREYFRKNHNLELHLVTVWGSTTDDPRIHGFDAAMQFFPGAVGKTNSKPVKSFTAS